MAVAVIIVCIILGACTGIVGAAIVSMVIFLIVATNCFTAVFLDFGGGMGIILETLAPKYLALGLSPELVHRIVAMSPGCFDAMPHNGVLSPFLLSAA